jgi:hypothetical protein
MSTEPTAYLVERVRDCLLRDPEVGELDLHIAIDGTRVVVTGHVSTQQRREAIDRVVADCLPDHELRNDTTVPAVTPVPTEEVL